MKLNGKKIEGPNVEVVVIPRSSGNLVFKAQSVLDYEIFEAICPTPKPREIIKPSGERTLAMNEKSYLDALDEWASKKTDWMVLKSLEATESLEWETVDMDEPDSWANYRDELKAASLSPMEIARIVNAVTIASGLDQKKIDEATAAFLAGLAEEQENVVSLGSEPSSTPSGEAASDLE